MRCQRFSASGERCNEPAASLTGWCGACEGFRRPDVDRAVVVRSMTGMDIGTLTVTGTAIDSFLTHHGGSASTAAFELADLVTALATSGRVGDEDSRIALADRGYCVLLDQNLAVLLDYRAETTDLTHAQAVAGVTPRVRGRVTGLLTGETRRVEPRPIRLTSRAVKTYSHLTRVPVEDAEDRLAALVAAALPATGGVREDGGVEVELGEVRVVLTAELDAVRATLRPRA